ncbi:unnamed protein product [Paramecium octaurelia]|uniref:Tetratricopeptide repeat protein n=1 Tax=Paramecium octaurelia TaxID=43137 RepID=A0A8S1Y8J9_PAROT|nr:unnamed protein product [Paramecium octaurelia]
MKLHIHNINEDQSRAKSENQMRVENDLSELSINENEKEFNKFISNYQSLISYCTTLQKYICHLGKKKELSKDNQLLGFCKEVFAKIKEINERFDQLNMNLNLSQDINEMDKIKNKNDSLLTLFSQAKELYSKEKKTEAFQKFTEVLRINPNFIDARIYRGNLSLDVNNTFYAQFDFEEALKQDKYNLKALKGITIAFKMQCNYELGLKYALKVIKHEPKSPIGNFNAADCLKFLGQYNENTLRYINQAIDQEKRRFEQKLQVYFRNKGEILFGLNRESEAREFVLKALELNQNYELAIKTLKRFDDISQRRINT